jgi:NADPH:quinone reductase-like Zn-dependent oxidoreductase
MEARVVRWGEFAVVKKESLALPLGAEDVEVAVLCAAFGELDVRTTQGEMSELAGLPLVPGHSGLCGMVRRCGGAVQHVKHGDRVVAFATLGSPGALCESVVCDGSAVARVSETCDAAQAAAAAEPALRAFLALQYQLRGLRGETVLVADAARGPLGEVALQLAQHLGLSPLAACATAAEATVLAARFPGARVVVAERPEELAAAVLRATGGLGVDCVYESGATPASPAARRARIGCLAAHGVWCVQSELQLDPPESRALLLRAARLGFVFPQAWLLSPLLRGRLLHLVHEVARLLGAPLSVSSIDRFPLSRVAAAREAVARADGAVVVLLK